MNKYKIAIWEEISGFVDVEAESKEKAEEIAEELLHEYGCEKIFYSEWNFGGADVAKYNGKHTHRDSQVLSCEEVK